MAESAAIPTTAAAAPAISRPGFWERLVAFVVDLSLISFANNITQQFDQSGVVLFVLCAAYFVYFWSGNGGGRTWGQRVMGLRVIREDGSALTIGQSVVRFLGILVSLLAVGIGVIWVAFDAKKQGWHDKFAGSIVVADAPVTYPAHPVTLTVEYPTAPSRFWAIPIVGILVKLIALIPIYIALFFVVIALMVALLVLWIPVLIMGSYPTWGRDFVNWAIRWSAQITAFIYGLTDRYPLPSSAPDAPVKFAVEAAPTSSRLWAIPVFGFIAKVIVLVPASFLVYLVANAVGIAALLIAWAPVLFTGVYPRWTYRFVVAYMRWTARMDAFVGGVTDTYPRVWNWEQ